MDDQQIGASSPIPKEITNDWDGVVETKFPIQVDPQLTAFTCARQSHDTCQSYHPQLISI